LGGGSATSISTLGHEATHEELKKRKNEPRTWSQACRPPFGGSGSWLGTGPGSDGRCGRIGMPLRRSLGVPELLLGPIDEPDTNTRKGNNQFCFQQQSENKALL
jgi:hypothetical protein